MGRALRTVAERQSAGLATAFALLVVLLPSLPLTSTAESGALTLALVTLAPGPGPARPPLDRARRRGRLGYDVPDPR